MELERKTNVLLVDDQPGNLIAMESILSDLKQNLVKATSGKAALSLILKTNFSVILMDINMPVMDGIETATLIRQRRESSHTPIIFVTAFNRDEEQLIKGYKIGAVDYIIKPLIPEILRWKVSVFVDLYQKTMELKRRLEENELLNRQLSAANLELEAFNYTISHDLRAPLRGIEGFAKALKEDHSAQLDRQGKHYLQNILLSMQKMKILFEEMLKLSRATGNEMIIEEVNLSLLAADIIQEFQKLEPKRKVRLVIEDDICSDGDQQLLKIMLSNLLTNAWKFTSKCNHPEIEFGIEKIEGQPAYFVRDNGVGFDMADADRLFTPFRRLHSDKDFPGTGIGLATVQRIIHRHGGNVWAEGKPGQGAKFCFTLPVNVSFTR